jgi:DNA polymerase V
MNAMLLRPALDPEALPLPLLGRLVPAGFPSPADDYLEGEIDLNRLLIERPAACYLMRVSGPSMSGAGIMDGDLVVVDRSVVARAGHVVVAVIHGEMTIKRLRRLADGRVMLKAEHPGYPSIIVGEDSPAEVWGVVVGCVRKMG